MTRKILAASFALFAVFAAYAGSQDTDAAEESGLAFPTEIEQVTVDMVVTDKDGNPINDLSAAEFEIQEDGKRQTITSFEMFEVQVPDREPVEVAIEAPPPLPVQTTKVSSNTDEEERQGRTFVIVFDDVHLTVFTAQQAKQAVANFLKNETYEGDRVTLVAPGSGSWWTTIMPDGLDDLMDTLEQQEALLFPDMERDRLSDYEAMRIHNFRDNMVLDRVMRRYATFQVSTVLGRESRHARNMFTEQDPYVTSKAAETYYAATARNHVTLGAIKRALNSLVRIQGRKSMILVSEGFVYDTHLREFRDILTAARKANTAVYFLDTTGLKGVATIMDAEFSQLPSQEDQGFAFAQEYERSEGSVSIASDTGGFTVRNDNDLALGLKRIADETRAYYLIGYNPTNTTRDGKFRKIKVKVPHRRGTKIRARKGYYAPSDKDVEEEIRVGKDPAFQIALDSPYNVPDIPLRMTHFVREETFLDKAKVYIAAEVDIDGLEFEKQEGLDVAAVNFLMVAVHRESGEYFRIDQKMDLKLSPETRAELSRTWLPIVRDFDLGPGHYRAKLVLRDKATDRLGTVIHNFEIPDLAAFRVSTPVLSDIRETSSEGLPGDRLALMARREFVPDSELFCEFHVYGATKLASSGMPRVTMAYEVRRSDGTLFTNDTRSLILPTEVGALSRMIGFSLEWATPGDYELVMSVKDELSGKRVEMLEPFSVVEAPAAAADQAPPAQSPPAQTAQAPAESTGR